MADLELELLLPKLQEIETAVSPFLERLSAADLRRWRGILRAVEGVQRSYVKAGITGNTSVTLTIHSFALGTPMRTDEEMEIDADEDEYEDEDGDDDGDEDKDADEEEDKEETEPTTPLVRRSGRGSRKAEKARASSPFDGRGWQREG